MNHLTTRELCLFIPDILVNDFEAAVLDAYFENGAMDLVEATHQVDYYGEFSYSYTEYGEPYRTSEENLLTLEETQDIVESYFDEVFSDVNDVFEYHHLFYTDYGLGQCRTLKDLQQMWCANHPNVEVW